MFSYIFYNKAKNFTIFILIFTVLFILVYKTFSYSLPFVIAFVIALFTKPIMKFLMIKCRLPRSLSALLSTLVVFTLFLTILTIVIYKISVESRQLLSTIPDFNVQDLVGLYIGKVRVYFNHVDPSIIQKAQDQMAAIISNAFGIATNLLNKLISFAIGLPILFLIIFVTLLSTYFFTKDMPDITGTIVSIFSDKQREKVCLIIYEITHMIGEYIKAYSFIITISFVEILIGFLFFKVKYALILSLLCWILEMIPILGIFVVFFPLIAIYYFSGNYFVALGLLILWVIVISVRQIIEPKIVSSSLGLHPLAVLTAIFIGLTAYGFLGMIYILSAMVFYKILHKSQII